MDKDIFTSVELAEIKKGVKGNGRNIADNSLRIMTLTDKVDNVKNDYDEYMIQYRKDTVEHNKKMDRLFAEMAENREVTKQLLYKLDNNARVDRFSNIGVV